MGFLSLYPYTSIKCLGNAGSSYHGISGNIVFFLPCLVLSVSSTSKLCKCKLHWLPFPFHFLNIGLSLQHAVTEVQRTTWLGHLSLRTNGRMSLLNLSQCFTTSVMLALYYYLCCYWAFTAFSIYSGNWWRNGYHFLTEWRRLRGCLSLLLLFCFYHSGDYFHAGSLSILFANKVA